MLADQFYDTVTAARTTAAADELAHKLWRAHAEGHLADADAEAVSESLQARRAALSDQSAERRTSHGRSPSRGFLEPPDALARVPARRCSAWAALELSTGTPRPASCTWPALSPAGSTRAGRMARSPPRPSPFSRPWGIQLNKLEKTGRQQGKEGPRSCPCPG